MEEYFLNWIILPIFLWIFLWIWITEIPKLKNKFFSLILKKRKFILKNFKIDIAKQENFSYVEWHRNSDSPTILKFIILYLIGLALSFLWQITFESTKRLELEIGQFADLINLFILF